MFARALHLLLQLLLRLLLLLLLLLPLLLLLLLVLLGVEKKNLPSLTQEYTNPYSPGRIADLTTAGIEVAPHYHQSL